MNQQGLFHNLKCKNNILQITNKKEKSNPLSIWKRNGDKNQGKGSIVESDNGEEQGNNESDKDIRPGEQKKDPAAASKKSKLNADKVRKRESSGVIYKMVNMRFVSQLIRGISRVFQKLLKYFSDIAITPFFVLPVAGVLPVYPALNLNDLDHNCCGTLLDYILSSQHPALLHYLLGYYLFR